MAMSDFFVRVPANHSLKLTEITACFFAARHEFTK
jgi:hypothetical protein